MASLPKKGIKGTNFKVWAVETLNALIDYLHGARVKPGYGISVRETPSGTIVELAKKEAPTINNIAGGGTVVAQDISASVSGNTASVALSGSTSSVEIVGGSNVSVTGNTNGQVVVSTTGGTGGTIGFPDFTNGTNVSGGTTYGPFDYPVWLIGNVTNYTSTGATGYCECILDIEEAGAPTSTIYLMQIRGLIAQGTLHDYVPTITNLVSFPIPAGVSFYVNPDVYASEPASINLEYYTCI